ncbi:MAG: glycoside hydrolase family 26 protein [Muribaculaceae bacterium]|nr:glycoside hydrolase family 26 protein [Muribaculaceae bacterium]
MNRLIVPAVAACLLIGGSGCGSKTQTQEEPVKTPAETLKEKLSATVEEKKVMFGHHDDPVYGHNWNGEGTSDMLAVAGAYPAVMSWDLGALELGKPANLDGVPFDSIRSHAMAQDARGGINTFSWHLYHPLSGADSWDTSDSLAVSKMVNTPEGKEAYLKQLDLVADFFLSLKDKDGDRIGVIFRPWHEHTGSWFWWGTDNCSTEDYKALWTIMHEKFDERGVDNVVWAYSPDRCDSAEKYMARYPGDEFVDILGADIYHFNGAEGTDAYKKAAGKTLEIATSEAKKRGKIAAFTETGLESVTIDDWYTSILLPILKSYPIAYVTVWRNAHDKPEHFYVPYPGHPAENNFREFCANPSIKVIKQ